MTSQTNENAFETTVESMLINGRLGKRRTFRMGCRASIVPCPCRCVPADDTTKTMARVEGPVRRRPRTGNRCPAGERTQPERHTPRVASRVQIPEERGYKWPFFKPANKNNPEAVSQFGLNKVDGDTASAMPSR